MTGVEADDLEATRPVPDRTDDSTRQRRTPLSIVRRDAAGIYGGLLVTALITVQWRSDAVPELIALTIVISVLVFWLTHVWSEIVEHRLRGPASRADVRRIAAGEASMLASAAAPVLALSLARIGVVSVDQAISLALIVSIAQLFLWGLAIGRALRRGWAIALVAASVECGLGLALVALKVIVVH
jgi:hypothetical protein